MTFRSQYRAKISNAKLLEMYYAAKREHAELIRCIDRESPTGTANVHTVWNHPEFKPLLDRVNKIYAECVARQILD